jgi:hypothetical protein
MAGSGSREVNEVGYHKSCFSESNKSLYSDEQTVSTFALFGRDSEVGVQDSSSPSYRDSTWPVTTVLRLRWPTGYASGRRSRYCGNQIKRTSRRGRENLKGGKHGSSTSARARGGIDTHAGSILELTRRQVRSTRIVPSEAIYLLERVLATSPLGTVLLTARCRISPDRCQSSLRTALPTAQGTGRAKAFCTASGAR